MARLISAKWCNRIYDLLVEYGADEDIRESFCHIHSTEGCNEWRFQGKFGFGGKFRNHREWYADCYPEDENPERGTLLKELNEKLLSLWEQRI